MSFRKMYLVTEQEYAQLKKPTVSKIPKDVKVLTDSLKAVNQKRKKLAIRTTVPAIKLKKYDVGGGVTALQDKDLVKRVVRAASPDRVALFQE